MSYKYKLWVSIDYDPWFLQIETNSFYKFAIEFIKNFNHQKEVVIKFL